jgi:hypothetical protein
MKKIIGLGFVGLLGTMFWIPSGWSAKLTQRVTNIYLGQTRIQLKEYRHGPGKHFVHVHDNETTARRAALSYIQRHGGTLLTLSHTGQRNIRFILRHQEYWIDPNRIYTPKGVRQTLSHLSHYSPAARIEVEKLAKQILHRLPWKKVIAVHNNREYSMRDYVKGHVLARDARRVHRARNLNLRNFYLVTRYKMYRKLARAGFNVVLQARNVTDDGSLSVRLAKRNYINVESAYGARRIQYRMLRNI